jgi:hypothetical protein
MHVDVRSAPDAERRGEYVRRNRENGIYTFHHHVYQDVAAACKKLST